jgi:hypothetical protein
MSICIFQILQKENGLEIKQLEQFWLDFLRLTCSKNDNKFIIVIFIDVKILL